MIEAAAPASLLLLAKVFVSELLIQEFVLTHRAHLTPYQLVGMVMLMPQNLTLNVVRETR